jgi:hypothetical protein
MYKQTDIWMCGLDGRVVWIVMNDKGGNVWYGIGRTI